VRITSPDWIETLEQVDVSRAEGRADLLVTSAADRVELSGTEARAILTEGRSVGVARQHLRTYLALPDLSQTRLLVPLDRGNVLRYVLETRWLPRSRRRALRKTAVLRVPRLAELMRRMSSQCITVATEASSSPFLVASAAERLDEQHLDFFLVCGEGDYLARSAFVCFQRAAASPSWVVKFARVRGYAEPFERDERGLLLAAAAGGRAAAHSPRLLDRFMCDGFESSVESAAVGSNLADVLQSTLARSKKSRIVQAIAGWIVDVGLETRCAPARTETERLRRDVLPNWPAVPASTLRGLDEVRGVLQHNDLGAWNVVVDDSSFTVLDWESAHDGGLPLWDLWYFLADVLPVLDGKAEDRVTAFRRLFRGEAVSSPVLFEWTRRAVSAFDIHPDQVGRLATLCWLHHGLSHLPRTDSLARHSRGPQARVQWPPERFPHIWLEDPDLGLMWNRWQNPARKQPRR
jgi:hypothetical protein